jgi:hypothetical protein
LRELREKYDEEVQSAEKKYLKEGETFDQQRSEALKRTTELQRTIRGISPFQQVRERYEELSATELIEALHNARPIRTAYVRAKEAVEAAISMVQMAVKRQFWMSSERLAIASTKPWIAGSRTRKPHGP